MLHTYFKNTQTHYMSIFQIQFFTGFRIIPDSQNPVGILDYLNSGYIPSSNYWKSMNSSELVFQRPCLSGICFTLRWCALLSEWYALLSKRDDLLSERCALLCERYALLCERYALLSEGYARLSEWYALLLEPYALLSEWYNLLLRITE